MLLNKYSEPAERARGCVFAERFVNAAEVVRNGGTITGTPVINQGATLDGTGDKITYLTQYGVKSIVFQIKLDSTTEDILKLSSSHSIAASGGTLTATGLSSPTYYIGGSATQTIATDWVWVAISTATAFDADDIQLGYISGYGGFEIENLKYFTEELTDQEALDYSNGGGFWNYENEAYFNLPMTLESHDPTNTRTLDVVGGGINATWSAGATAPTKNTTKRGYNFDGGDVMTMGAIPVGTNDFTAIALVRDSEGTGVGSDGILGDANGGAAGHIIPLYFNSGVGNFTVNIDGSSWAGGSVVSDGTWHVIGISADRSDKAHYFVDGIEVGTGQDISAKVAANVNVSNPQIGRVGAGTYLIGDVSDMIFWNDRALTPMQHADIAGRILRQINQL